MAAKKPGRSLLTKAKKIQKPFDYQPKKKPKKKPRKRKLKKAEGIF